MKRSELAKKIDHTLLAANATELQIQELCRMARELGTLSVCVNSCRIKLASNFLESSDVLACSVVGFPLGASHSALKVKEAEMALEDGATEIDMVMNVGWLYDNRDDDVLDDIKSVRAAIGSKGILKVIIEAAILTEEQKRRAAELVVHSGAEFVKTSTGMNPAGGATVADVRLLRSVVGDRIKIKAAGGIRDYPTAMAMIEAGADRIGASSTAKILDEAPI